MMKIFLRMKPMMVKMLLRMKMKGEDIMDWEQVVPSVRSH